MSVTIDAPARLKPGIHALSAEDYHADQIADAPSLSASIAHILLNRSPLHAWTAHSRLNPNYEPRASGTLDHGTAAHALLFEARKPLIVDADDWRSKAAREARDQARVDGQVPLLAKDARVVQAMCDAIGRQLDGLDCHPRPFTSGKAEQTLVWEEAGGVICRARLDWLRDDLEAIDDLKTTTTANPRDWCRRRLFEDGKDVQAAWYLRGLTAVTGADALWRFVVVENKPPYALSVVSLSPDALKLANAKIHQAIAIWRRCLDTGDWPGYPAQVCYAELPPWERI
ncbi:MAG: PD-(D/E)XK nuclease-like domain-containing protein [Solirubrobacteraceae bacterium]